MHTFSYYFSPETLQVLKHATAREIHRFCYIDTDWETEEDLTSIITDLTAQIRDLNNWTYDY